MKSSRQSNMPVLFDIGVGNKHRLLDAAEIVQQKGEDKSSILPALHYLTSCDTTFAWGRHVEKNPDYILTLAKVNKNM